MFSIAVCQKERTGKKGTVQYSRPGFAEIAPQSFDFTVWDLGAWTNNAIWNYYLHDTVGLIFVVDLNNKERIQEARDKLHRILNDDKTFSSLLVLANKQELPGAMSIPEVTAELDLDKVQHRNYFVQGCCAKRGEGLFEGLEWLASTVSMKKS